MIEALRRIFFRSPEVLQDYQKNNQKVCMVVWNTFETDARVTKEARTLMKNGKNVTVVAVHQPGRTKPYENLDNLKVIRINRTLRRQKQGGVGNQRLAAEKIGNTVSSSANPRTSLKKKVRGLFKFVPITIINIRFFLEAFKQNSGIYHANDLNTLVPVYLASRLRGAKLIYDAHEVSTDRVGWKNKRYWEWIEKKIMNRADATITTNYTRAAYFRDRYHIPLPYIVKNVPPYEEIMKTHILHDQLKLDYSIPIVLYQGGLQADRGLENMIQLIPLVESAHFVFIGDGRLKQNLILMAEEIGVTDRTHFLGAIPNSDLLTYTSSATIGLQLLLNTCFNHYSACSNKLHEYIMAGIPVVGSDLPEIRRVIEDTETGILVNPDDIQEIAASINKLLTSEALYKKYSENTKTAALKHRWENEEQALLEAYQILN